MNEDDPNGGIAASAVRFDAPNAAFDFCALFSVFTHMYEGDIRQSLAEIRRMLRDDGVAITTFFLFNAARWPGGQSRDVGLTMRHELNDHTRYHNTEDRLRAIAYDRNWIERLLLDNGFKTLKIIPDRWAGSSSPHYQDQVVFRKQPRETAVVFEASPDRSRLRKTTVAKGRKKGSPISCRETSRPGPRSPQR